MIPQDYITGNEKSHLRNPKIAEIFYYATSIPKECFKEHKDKKGFWVIPEYCFAVKLKDQLLKLSSEHKSVKWVSYDEALSYLKYDSNKTAPRELKQRLFEDR
ncbi:MAG: hypothetical protein L6407_03665 [Candidatus Delongbacteria bacterium]|nr:hypothetical protein [Candidatus Delongbacteria bacterium]